jgi:hypothetical protein
MDLMEKGAALTPLRERRERAGRAQRVSPRDDLSASARR